MCTIYTRHFAVQYSNDDYFHVVLTYVMPPDNLVGPWLGSNLAVEVDVVALGDGGGINAFAEGQAYLRRI